MGAFAPVSGNDGRVKSGDNAVAGLNAWTMTKKTTGIRVIHFETTADADGNLYPNNILKGTSEATTTFSGYTDTDLTNATDSGTPGLRNGLIVVMDYILVKDTPWGFLGTPTFIENIKIGTKIGEEASTFEGEGVVVGSPGSTRTST